MTTGRDFTESAFLFDAGTDRLVGIIARPTGAIDPGNGIGVLIVVGGPQYRVGSHRQFVLLSRALAMRGFTTMRFDCAGMGDSSGAQAPFTDRDRDIRAALDAFAAREPTLDGFAIWGLCDAASAALMYAADDARVRHLVLLNPWVRSDVGLARTHLKHYYGSQLTDRDFWRRLVTGKVGVWRALAGFVATARTARTAAPERDAAVSYQARMARGWKRFSGDILLICSGDDLTAREFVDHAAGDAEWKGLVDQVRVARCDLADADHTFSRAAWRDRVALWTADWLADRRAAPPTAESGRTRSRPRELA